MAWVALSSLRKAYPSERQSSRCELYHVARTVSRVSDRISRRYPIVEAVDGLAYGLIVWYFGPGGQAVVYAALFSSLLVISYIDFDHQIIPDVISFRN